jgi:hypothetical protein
MSDDRGVRWCGWLRRSRGAPWRLVVESKSLEEAARLLALEGDKLRLASCHRFLTGGRRPPPGTAQGGPGATRTLRRPAEDMDPL